MEADLTGSQLKRRQETPSQRFRACWDGSVTITIDNYCYPAWAPTYPRKQEGSRPLCYRLTRKEAGGVVLVTAADPPTSTTLRTTAAMPSATAALLPTTTTTIEEVGPSPLRPCEVTLTQ